MKKVLGISLTAVAAAQLAKAQGTMENVPLARMYGEARGVQHRRGQTVIMGDFRAVNSETLEEFSSSVVYLPQGLHETVLVSLDEPGTIVRFAYDIWAEPDPKGKSYTIGFKDLLEKPDAPDPLAAIFADKLPEMVKPAKK